MTQILTSLHGRKVGLGPNGELICPKGIIIGDPDTPAVQVSIPVPASRIVDATAATLTVTQTLHDGKTVTLNRAAGIAVTLPAATGSGTRLRFIVGTTVTSNSTTIKVADATDVMTGVAFIANDTDASVSGFETASTSDTITFNGTTTGGIKGDIVELEDIATDLWSVSIRGAATGTEATPFSATVS